MRRNPPTEPRVIPTTVPAGGPSSRPLYVAGIGRIVWRRRRVEMDLVSGCKVLRVIVLVGVNDSREVRLCIDRRVWSKKMAGGERFIHDEIDSEGSGAIAPGL